MIEELIDLNKKFDGSDESAMDIAYDIAHKYSSCRLCKVGKIEEICFFGFLNSSRKSLKNIVLAE